MCRFSILRYIGRWAHVAVMGALAILAVNGCVTAKEFTPRTSSGNQCKNECMHSYTVCTKGNRFAPAACTRQRNECYDGCRRFDKPQRTAERSQSQKSDESSSSLREDGLGASIGSSPEGASALKECRTGKKCTSNDSCLSDDFCHLESFNCMRMDCARAHTGPRAEERVEEVVASAQTLAIALERATPFESTDSTMAPNTQKATEASKPADAGMRRSFSVAEAAVVCGVGEDVIRDWIKEKKLRAVQIGEDYRISRSELARTWKEMGGGELFD